MSWEVPINKKQYGRVYKPSALLTPLIALIALWIAYQQMKSNRDKVRLDLFEKRMKIFLIVRESLGTILADGSSKNINWKDFHFAIEQSKFILSKELQEFLTEIETKTRQIRAQEVLLFGVNDRGGLPVGERRNKICKENSEFLKWLTDQMEPLQNRFAKFMKMNRI